MKVGHKLMLGEGESLEVGQLGRKSGAVNLGLRGRWKMWSEKEMEELCEYEYWARREGLT